MRDDRPIPGRKQLIEQALDAQRVFVKAELDEQVTPAAQRQQPTLAQKLRHVARAEDLHAERELERDARLAHGRAQAVKAHLQRLGCVVFKRAALIAVRRGDQMRHTGLRRHGSHQHRRLQIRCAVIDPRKNMCVQIDHGYPPQLPYQHLPILSAVTARSARTGACRAGHSGGRSVRLSQCGA